MRYELERSVVVLSVRELCETALHTGDLDTRIGKGSASFASARAGAQIHRRLQEAGGMLYRAEVPLSNTTYLDGISFEVHGRADGILPGDILTVEEIKSVPDKLFDRPPLPAYDAQLRCYACFLSRERDLERVRCRMTLATQDGERMRHIDRIYTREELSDFYGALLGRILPRAKRLVRHETVLRPTFSGGRFPYSSVREGQDIMIRECYRDIKAGKRLFVEAPTGTGKTLSSLYPAVRALGDGYGDKIFYLTAKTSTAREAFRAASQIFEGGARILALTLSSREQLCRNIEARTDPAGISRHCNPESCPYAKAFYDKVGPTVEQALSEHSGFPRTLIAEYAERAGICPYEFQLELSEYCDLIICDYNYVFDPRVYLRRYFEQEHSDFGKYIFLVDEAHNLADRAREMYSAELIASDVAEALLLLPPEDKKTVEPLETLLHTVEGMRELCRDNLQKDEEGHEYGFYLSHSPMTSFHTLVYEVRGRLEEWLRKNREHPSEEGVWLFFSKLRRFELISEYYDEHFLTFFALEDGVGRLRLICLDPSGILYTLLSRAEASVLFSATLTPTDYFADILGGGKEAVRISLPSPFDPSNLLAVAVTGISTRYEDRSKSIKKLVSVIAATASGKRGNYIVYFPSYAYMEEVYKLFAKIYPKLETVVQTRGMGYEGREAFLNAFLPDGKLRIGFCVLGGSFSEGVDLPGDRLIGTVIVGTGLPGISNERNILREHYDMTRESGFEYAYVYPGMNRVLQAAGRVIRTDGDRGVAVFVDDRYAEPRIRGLFPDHLQGIKNAGNSQELAELVGDFWDKK